MNIHKKANINVFKYEYKETPILPFCSNKYVNNDDTGTTQLIYKEWTPEPFDSTKKYCNIVISGLALGSDGSGNGTVKINQAWQPYSNGTCSWENESNRYLSNCSYISSLYYAISTNVNNNEQYPPVWEPLYNNTLTISSSTIDLAGSDTAIVYFISRMGAAIYNSYTGHDTHYQIPASSQGCIQIQAIGSDTTVIGSGTLDSLTFGDGYINNELTPEYDTWEKWNSIPGHSYLTDSNGESAAYSERKAFIFKNSYFTQLPGDWITTNNGNYNSTFENCTIGSVSNDGSISCDIDLKFKGVGNNIGYHLEYYKTLKNIKTCKKLKLDFSNLAHSCVFNSESLACGTNLKDIQINYGSNETGYLFSRVYFTASAANDYTGYQGNEYDSAFAIKNDNPNNPYDYACGISPEATITINVPYTGNINNYKYDVWNSTYMRSGLFGLLPPFFLGTVVFPTLPQSYADIIKSQLIIADSIHINNYDNIKFIGKQAEPGPV